MDVGEEMKTKGIALLFNRIIRENFPNLKKERLTRLTKMQEAYKTPNHQNQKRNKPRLNIIKTLST
jgi:hypothetical protein